MAKVTTAEGRVYIGKDGVKRPSVTTILNCLAKPALVPWACGVTCDFIEREIAVGTQTSAEIIARARKEAIRVRQQAADVGTQTHWLIDKMIQGHLYDAPFTPEQGTEYTMEDEKGGEKEAVAFVATEEHINAVEAFRKWEKEMEFHPLFSEIELASDKYDFAGTADIVCEFSPKKTRFVGLVDIKTGSGVYKEHALQVAAYAHALEEMGVVESIDRVGIIRLDKQTGMPEWKPITQEVRRKAWSAFIDARNIYSKLKEVKL